MVFINQQHRDLVMQELGYETPEEHQKPDPEEQSAGKSPDDYSDDAEALASAGFGTDEDYGYYGGDE